MNEIAGITDFKDLIAWRKPMELCVKAYELTRSFPKEEMFGLVNQIRRSSVSVPANVAEGYGWGHLGDYLRFLRNARGSLCELETEVLLATRLGFLPTQESQEFMKQLREAASVLQGLIGSLKEVQSNQERE
jgi:four helix bundle protein